MVRSKVSKPIKPTGSFIGARETGAKGFSGGKYGWEEREKRKNPEKSRYLPGTI